MKKTIFSVGKPIPSRDCEVIPFDSDRSLADADIILYWPTLDSASYQFYSGRTYLSDSSSLTVPRYAKHWLDELRSAFQSGRLVIVFLDSPKEAYLWEQRHLPEFSAPVSSYDAVPGLEKVRQKTGKKVRLTREAGLIIHYWKEFAGESTYRVEVFGEFSRVLLETRGGEAVVGAINVHESGGAMLYLPPLDLKYSVPTTRSTWDADALRFGGRLIGSIVGIFDSLRSVSGSTPPPTWVDYPTYMLSAEQRIGAEIASSREKIKSLESKLEELESDLVKSGSLKRLLYEQGKPLEASIHEALELFGFTVRHFHENTSEFDVLFESGEGRFLGEVEGKDNRSINIDKISQLERNLHEDFEREEVSVFAKGVLFGNAYRLVPIAERQESFTAKCVEAAKRAKIALVRTPDLFKPARSLTENNDSEYARSCREAILGTEGAVVDFPRVPGKDAGGK
ncbi:MAG TPA: hypothetical protein VMW27_02200 [Thermoanaerobaculia bacterium]|nr:hypothetical protein [Thermoanaerobaculia bacterium]